MALEQGRNRFRSSSDNGDKFVVHNKFIKQKIEI